MGLVLTDGDTVEHVKSEQTDVRPTLAVVVVTYASTWNHVVLAQPLNRDALSLAVLALEFFFGHSSCFDGPWHRHITYIPWIVRGMVLPRS